MSAQSIARRHRATPEPAHHSRAAQTRENKANARRGDAEVITSNFSLLAGDGIEHPPPTHEAVVGFAQMFSLLRPSRVSHRR